MEATKATRRVSSRDSQARAKPQIWTPMPEAKISCSFDVGEVGISCTV